MDGMYAEPEHLPAETAPCTTSQYEPSGSEVLKVADHELSALLMATKPDDPSPRVQRRLSDDKGKEECVLPRPNAICDDCGDTQLLSALEPTVLWKPTMPAMAVQRC